MNVTKWIVFTHCWLFIILGVVGLPMGVSSRLFVEAYLQYTDGSWLLMLPLSVGGLFFFVMTCLVVGPLHAAFTSAKVHIFDKEKA